MGIEEQQEVVNGIVRGLIDSRPPGWLEITFEAKSLARFSSISNLVTRQEGKAERETFPWSINRDVIKLRSGMYRNDVGAWFSMRIHVIPPARFKVDFDYDEKPSCFFGQSPEEFAEDFSKFPRSSDNVPAWLKEELRLAEQEE